MRFIPVIILCITALHGADSMEGHADLVFGVRSVEDSYDETTFGAALTLHPSGPWTINASLLYGFGSGDSHDGIDYFTQDTETLEIAIGGGYEWLLDDGFTPSFAAGLAMVNMEVELGEFGFKDDDTGFGPWFEVGLSYRGEKHIVGVHVRYTRAPLEIEGITINGGGLLPTVRLGFLF